MADSSGQTESDRKSTWLPSAVLVAIVGLVGTGFGAVVQGCWNTRLERQKFEFSLIQKALDTKNQEEAVKSLKFLVKTGLISQLDGSKILTIAENTPQDLPLALGAVLPSSGMSIRDAKEVLAHIGLFTGKINDQMDKNLSEAIIEFQKRNGIFADGQLGAQTSYDLRKEWPEYFRND